MVNKHSRHLIVLENQYGYCDVMCIRSIDSLGVWGYKMLLFRTQIHNGQASVYVERVLDTILGDFEENNKTDKTHIHILIVYTVLTI